MSTPPGENSKPDESQQQDRRSFLSLASTTVMGSGLAAGYGMLAYVSGRFLYSGSVQQLAWLFVTEAAKVKPGDVVKYETPARQIVTITRRGNTGTEEDFVALSSTCPHLGCKVHWEPQNNRFYCPCHNGAFDPTGKATAGPPAEARQSLPHYPLKIENGLIFIKAPLEALG
jgi:Rieske Fe-S protein